jgi:hypothetical protein
MSYGLAPLRIRGLERVTLHADLVMLARLSQALARARANVEGSKSAATPLLVRVLPVKDEACARGLVPGQRADRERANDAGESDDDRAHYEQ